MDIEKLIKVLGMMGSEHDGEALAALRTAQKMMAAAKVSWSDILKPTVQVGPVYRHDPYDQQRQYQNYQQSAMQQEMLRKYAEEMERRAREQGNRTPNYSNDLYEAIFGHKRNR